MSRAKSLEPVDGVTVEVLVDNVSDSLSSTPSFVETEMAARWRSGEGEMSGACLCSAAHGLSFLITAKRGARSHTVLFDAGPGPDVLRRNAALLGADFRSLDAIVLSHGHWDHAGGLLAALDLAREARPSRRIPVHVHPDAFYHRALRGPDGRMRPFADVPKVEELARHGAEVHASRVAESLLQSACHVSGEIPRVTTFERGMPSQFRRKSDDGAWEPDPLLHDERWLVLHVAGLGLLLFSACSHAGIVNVLTHARAELPGTAIHCVLGGLHLAGENEKLIGQTVAAMRRFQIGKLAPGHAPGSAPSTHFANRLATRW